MAIESLDCHLHDKALLYWGHKTTMNMPTVTEMMQVKRLNVLNVVNMMKMMKVMKMRKIMKIM